MSIQATTTRIRTTLLTWPPLVYLHRATDEELERLKALLPAADEGVEEARRACRALVAEINARDARP